MKRNIFTVILIICSLIFISCAAGPNDFVKSGNEEGKIAGFWSGIWHGIISPIAFIVSLFNKNVNVYEVHNSGGWYNAGFLLGVSMVLGGSGGGAGSKWRKRRKRRMEEDE